MSIPYTKRQPWGTGVAVLPKRNALSAMAVDAERDEIRERERIAAVFERDNVVRL